MQEQGGSLLVEGYHNNGCVHVPHYGTFLPSPNNRLDILPGNHNSTNPIISNTNPGLAEQVTFEGCTLTTLNRLVEEKLFPQQVLLFSGLITDEFRFLNLVSYGDQEAAVRNSPVYNIFEAYVSKEVTNGIEGKVLAYGLIAPNWAEEVDVAVIDGVWSEDPNDNLSKDTLYKSIESHVTKNHKAIRVCSSVDKEKEGAFYVMNGFRLMKRNDAGYQTNERVNPGKIELVKILHPNFDVSLLDKNSTS